MRLIMTCKCLQIYDTFPYNFPPINIYSISTVLILPKVAFLVKNSEFLPEV